jgi:glycine/D-amino acid oxidase-like deaminating enzyme
VTTPDVAIVGGGIVGTTLAVELARRGRRVVLHERGVVAAGASGRNSGAVWRPTDRVLEALYLETLGRYRALPADLAAHLPPGAPARRFRLGDEPAGLLTLGFDEAGLAAQARAEAAAFPDLGVRYVPPEELRRLEPSLAPGLAAIRAEIAFPVAPAAATQAMAALARALGADVRENSPVRRVAVEAGWATGVLLDDGSVATAGTVVVAAGPWTPAVIDPGGSWRPIRPMWGVVVELALGDRAPSHVLEAGVVDVHGAELPESGFSLVTAGGRSSMGSTYLAEPPNPAAWEPRLRAQGARYVPAITGAPTTGLRACARPVSLDGRPLAGPVPGVTGLFVAAGHGPWGLSTGPATAAHVAALVAGEADPRPPMVAAATAADRFGSPPA